MFRLSGRDKLSMQLMDKFEWIGISNNEAIVRHKLQGHVYRYRPSSGSGWQQLVPSRIEMRPTAVNERRGL